jgi:hypothetical protein
VDRREEMLQAMEGTDGFASLRDLVKRHLDGGASREVLLEDLSQIRALVPEHIEDLVLNVMDLLTGWCAPSARL